MTTEQKRLYTLIGCGTFFTIPLWALGLWAFSCGVYIGYYVVIGIISELVAFGLLISQKNRLFWYFILILLSFLPSMVLGLALNTGAVLILAFGQYVSANLLMIGTLIFFTTYCYFPIKYYHDDYHKTEKHRLKSFDFEKGTYDITNPTLLRNDSFADYYFKSFLSKTHSGVIKLYLLFPISGGAIAIIAGKISKNLQLGIGLAAFFLSTIMFIQFGIPGLFNAWQVRQLEKKHGKKIMIDWGDEKDDT
jgi:hypothetical protein